MRARYRGSGRDGRSRPPEAHFANGTYDTDGRAVALIFRYIYETGANLPVDEVQKLLAGAVDPEVEEEAVTLAEKLHEDGRREGRKEGVEEGQRKTLLKQLRQRFGEPPAAAVERVRAAKEAQLESWLDRVLTAPSLDLVFAEG